MSTHITSPHNPRLKAIRKLHSKRERERSGLFAAEGEDLVAAARRAGVRAVDGCRVAGTGLGEASFHDVHAEALAAVSTLGSGTRVIGVYEQRWGAPAGPLCVYLHAVADPGNVGAVVRSAHAFGASCVALGPRCADPYSPKAVRASMGAVFSVALARAGVEELPGTRIALLAGAAEALRGDVAAAPAAQAGPAPVPATTREDDPRATARELDGVSVLVGSEREGLPAEVVAACERSARIPIASESLNAAMAATVALYELTRGSERLELARERGGSGTRVPSA